MRLIHLPEQHNRLLSECLGWALSVKQQQRSGSGSDSDFYFLLSSHMQTVCTPIGVDNSFILQQHFLFPLHPKPPPGYALPPPASNPRHNILIFRWMERAIGCSRMST